MKTGHKPAWGKIIAAAAILGLLALIWRFTPLSEFLTAENITGWAKSVRDTPWAPVVAVLAYTPAAFVMFPRPVITLATVVAFGPWLGFAYAMSGILLSALVTYYFGRMLKPQTVERIAGKNFERVKQVLRRHGLIAVLGIRIVPVAPFLVESVVAGAARTNLWHYTLGTMLGMTPGVAAESIFGGQITAALEDFSKVNWWLVALAALIAVFVTFFVGRWFAAKSESPAA